MSNRQSAAAVEIRPVRPEDAPALYEVAHHPDVARMIILLPSMEYPDTEAYVAEKQVGRHYLVATVDGRAVGSTTLNQKQNPRLAHSGTLGLMVHPDYWSQGIGTRLMAAILDLADNWLNLKRVELGVYSDNEAAIHLYQKFGFTEEGVKQAAAFGDGSWMDELVMARLRDLDQLATTRPPLQAPPSAATPLQDLTVRPLHPDDAEAMYQILRHPSVSRSTLQLPSQEVGLWQKRTRETRPTLHRLVATTRGDVIGNVTLHQSLNPRLWHTGGLGMTVHPDYWGQGVGNALMAAIIDLADNWLNLKRVELDVHADNAAAIHLYQKYGFEIEGRKRFHTYGSAGWVDTYFMGRVRTRPG